MPEQGTIPFSSWKEVLAGPARSTLERALPSFLMRQRWFGGKARVIDRVAIRDAAALPSQPSALLIVEVGYVEEGCDLYFVPLAHLTAAQARACRERTPAACLIECQGDEGAICDASVDEAFAQWLLQTAGRGTRVPFSAGELIGTAGRSYLAVRGDETRLLPTERNTSEQSNTSIRFGDRIIMKLFRRLEPGPNPDCELTQYLSDHRGNTHVPTFVGSLHHRARDGQETTLAMFQQLVHSQGDGWTWAMDELSRTYEECATRVLPQAWGDLSRRRFSSSVAEGVEREAPDVFAPTIKAVKALAQRTGELHLDLAAATDVADFRPRVMTRDDLTDLSLRLRAHAAQIFDALELGTSRLPTDTVESAGVLLGRRRELLERFRTLEDLDSSCKLTRVHGDYHLGQVLRVDQDFVILDFEGEPARALEERRSLQSPLKDVAGMLRSFSYAAQASYLSFVSRHPRDAGPLEPWSRLWERCVSASFLSTYRGVVAGAGVVPEEDAPLRFLLDAFLLDKALYELNYELNNRPTWARIPMLGILGLA